MSWTATATPTRARQGAASAPAIGLRPEIVSWRAGVFRAKGWELKAPAQGATRDDMLAGLLRMEQAAVPPGRSGALRRANPQPPAAFQTYMDVLGIVEAEAPPRAAQSVDKLRDAASKYLAFHAKLPRQEQDRPAAAERKRECERKLADLRGYNLRAEFKALGDPPWGAQTAMKAANLKATFDFESLPPDARVAEKLEGNNANPAFWVNKAGTGGGQEKSFLFKPTAPSAPLGFPEGGDSAREALAGRQADVVGAMTGLSFGVPETQIVSLGRDRFGTGAMDKIQPGGADVPVVGSLQQFAKGGKELRGFSTSTRDRVPVATCQKLAILDTLLLNCDRHSGNLLQTGTEEQPDLVPIDHGCSLPGQKQIRVIEQRFVTPSSNAMLCLPGTHQPFTPPMLAAINAIDPEAMVRTLGAEVDTLAAAHPQTGGKVGADSLEMSRRAAVFLKMAAPTLSPGTIQFTIGHNARALFNPDLDQAGFDTLAQSLITRAAPQQEAIAEYCTMLPGEREAMNWETKRLGWGDMELFQKGNMALVMAAYKTGTPRPKDDPRPTDLDENTPAELAKALAQFPTMTVKPDDEASARAVIKSWRLFQAYGGAAKLPGAIDALGLSASARRNAQEGVHAAANTLRDADALARAAAAAANNPEPWRKAMDYLRSLEPLLQAAAVPTYRQEVAKLDRAIAANTPARVLTQEINRVKHETVDLIRMRAGVELEALRQPLKTLIDRLSAGAGDERLDSLADARDAFDTAVVQAQGGHINDWEARRDRFKGYIDAGDIA